MFAYIETMVSWIYCVAAFMSVISRVFIALIMQVDVWL